MEIIIEELSKLATNVAFKLVISLIILVIGFKIINLLDKILKKEHKLIKLDPSAKFFVINFIEITLKVLLIIMILSIEGVPMASIVAIVGSFAVAIGLALQGGLSNIAGGLMILIFKPFKVGDYISFNDLEGTVKSITMFYTTIVTLDNKLIYLPNGNLSNSNIINYTANKIRRVDIEVPVAYSTNIDKLRSIINKVIDNDKLILKDQKNEIKLKKYGDSALIFSLRTWCKAEDYWNLYYDLTESVKRAFDDNGIEIPFNQVDIHMIS